MNDGFVDVRGERKCFESDTVEEKLGDEKFVFFGDNFLHTHYVHVGTITRTFIRRFYKQ